MCTVQELEAKVEAAAEEITGDMLCSTNDNSTVNLYESTRSNNLVFT
jgi:hypothetical protein